MSNISNDSSHVIGDIVLRLLLQLFVVLFAEMDLFQALALKFEIGLANLLDVERSLSRLLAACDIADFLFRCVRWHDWVIECFGYIDLLSAVPIPQR